MTFEYYDAVGKRYIYGAFLYSTVSCAYGFVGGIIGKHADEWEVSILAGDGVTVTDSGTISYPDPSQMGTNQATPYTHTPTTQSHTATLTIKINGVTCVTETEFKRSTSATITESVLNGWMPSTSIGTSAQGEYRPYGLLMDGQNGLAIMVAYLPSSGGWFVAYNLRGYVGPVGSKTVPFVWWGQPGSGGNTIRFSIPFGLCPGLHTLTDSVKGKKYMIQIAAAADPVEPDWPVEM